MSKRERLQKDVADAKAAYLATNDYYGLANDAAWNDWFKAYNTLSDWLFCQGLELEDETYDPEDV